MGGAGVAPPRNLWLADAARPAARRHAEALALRDQKTPDLHPMPLIDLTPSLEELQNEFRRRVREVNRLSRSLVNMPPAAAANATARTGDVLSIDIEGESALPRGYEVDADGTIRLPLIGSIRVEGLTSARIQDVVTKELSDRRLATDRRVTATLHRPR